MAVNIVKVSSKSLLRKFIRFPFGFIRILKALRKNDTLEALLTGILPEYQGKGASILMFKTIHENCIRRGITRIES